MSQEATAMTQSHDQPLIQMQVNTRHPADYVLLNEQDGTRWRGTSKGTWARIEAQVPGNGDELLAEMASRNWTLRCVEVPTGAGDADVGWEVVSYHMAAPNEHVEGVGASPREALARAIEAVQAADRG